MVKTGKKKIGAPAAVCIGTVSSLSILIGSVAVITSMVLKESINEKTAGMIILSAIGVATFIGCIIGSFAYSDKIATVCFSTGGAFCALMLIVHYLLFYGEGNSVLSSIIIMMIGTVMAYLVRNNKKRAGYKRIKKYRLG